MCDHDRVTESGTVTVVAQTMGSTLDSATSKIYDLVQIPKSPGPQLPRLQGEKLSRETSSQQLLTKWWLLYDRFSYFIFFSFFFSPSFFGENSGCVKIMQRY